MTFQAQHRLFHRTSATLIVFAATCFAPSLPLRAQMPPPTGANLIQLTLASKIDTKTAKVGDPVVTKIVGQMGFGGVTIPSGSRLTGKITAASRQPASVAFELDSLENKGKPDLSVRVDIIAIASPADNAPTVGLPSGSGGYGSMNPDGADGGGSPNSALKKPGSTIKNVTLGDNGTLTGTKDFKLETGDRIAVTMGLVTH